jgi:hypothetical protein
MKQIFFVAVMVSILSFSTAQASEDIGPYSLEEVMGLEQTKIALESDIRFFFDGEWDAL